MHVESFDSMEEAYASMEAAERSANEGLSPGQIALRDDDGNTRYWVQAVPDADLIVYGVAQPSFLIKRSADFDVDANRARGYVTGTAYSAAVPEGEFGDTHVSQIVPVTGDVWRLAQEKGWPDWSALFLMEHRDLGRLLAEAERISLGEAGVSEGIDLDVDLMLFYAAAIEQEMEVLAMTEMTGVTFAGEFSGVADIAHANIESAQAELDALIEADTTWHVV